MKKVIIGTVLLLTTTLSVFSQTKNITVAGRVIEDDTKEQHRDILPCPK